MSETLSETLSDETGWPTVPRTFLALDPQEHSLERSRVVLLPVPYDATTSYRSGARDGPAAIIEASRQMEDYAFSISPAESHPAGGAVLCSAATA